MVQETQSNLKVYQITIFIALFIGYACYNYNRKSVSFAIPKLMVDGLSKAEAGLILSSQNLAYAISKFVGGILSDRISSKILFSSGVLLSGLAAILFSNVDHVLLYTALWFLNGFAQGAGWPACAKLLRKWYSPSQFGTWWSLLSASSNVIGSVSPFIAGYLIINYGWRTSVFISGAVSVVMGFICFLAIVNTPEQIGHESFEKQIRVRRPSRTDRELRTYDVFMNPFIWIVSFCYLSVFCSKTSSVDWGQVYLIEEVNRSPYVGSAFTSSIETGGFFGGIIAGWLTDISMRRLYRSAAVNQYRGNPRMLVATVFMFIATICFHIIHFNIDSSTSRIVITIVGFVLGACLYGCIAIFGVAATESAPVQLSGTSHAIAALAGNIGAIISGLPFSFVANYYSWGAVFFLLEVMSGITTLIMFAFRNIPYRTKKVKRE